MIRKHKKQLIAASLLTLLPMVLGVLMHDRLPELMNARWGFDGSLPVLIFLFVQPLLLLGLLWLGVYVTARDPGNRDQNRKALSLVFWIVPILSNLLVAMLFAVSLGAAQALPRVFIIVQGLMFAAIGNYLPKTRRNATIGIKVSWAMSSDENWNATHRFAGRLWFVCGILMMLSTCLPAKLGLSLFLFLILFFALAPVAYSYWYYKKQLRAGTAPDVRKAVDPRYTKWGLMCLAAILILVAVVMFSGNIEYDYQPEAFTIEADFYSDLTLRYDVIEDVEYRETDDPGMRAMGWGSPRLLLGAFENEEFGTYTRYSYTQCESCVVVKSGEKVLVLSGRDDLETKIIYQELSARIGQ